MFLGEECFDEMGFGQSHWSLLKNERNNSDDSGKFKRRI
jgi:hypothetical protein